MLIRVLEDETYDADGDPRQLPRLYSEMLTGGDGSVVLQTTNMLFMRALRGMMEIEKKSNSPGPTIPMRRVLCWVCLPRWFTKVGATVWFYHSNWYRASHESHARKESCATN
jgi:hypothetical protein